MLQPRVPVIDTIVCSWSTVVVVVPLLESELAIDPGAVKGRDKVIDIVQFWVRPTCIFLDLSPDCLGSSSAKPQQCGCIARTHFTVLSWATHVSEDKEDLRCLICRSRMIITLDKGYEFILALLKRPPPIDQFILVLLKRPPPTDPLYVYSFLHYLKDHYRLIDSFLHYLKDHHRSINSFLHCLKDNHRPIHSMFGMSEKELESATFCFTKTDGTCLQDIPALLGLRRASLVMSPAQVAMVY